MAIMANDACGAPIPFEICLPTFFDGKLFHFKLRRAASARNLMELCDGRVEMARQVTIYFTYGAAGGALIMFSPPPTPTRVFNYNFFNVGPPKEPDSNPPR